MADRLQFKPRHRAAIGRLLSKHLPGVEAWAYGSRASGRSHDGSDLDLALRGPGRLDVPAARGDSACAMVSSSRLSGPGRGDGGKISNRRRFGRPEELQATNAAGSDRSKPVHVQRQSGYSVGEHGLLPARVLNQRQRCDGAGTGRMADLCHPSGTDELLRLQQQDPIVRPWHRGRRNGLIFGIVPIPTRGVHRHCRHGGRTELRRSRSAPPEDGFPAVQGCFRSKADRLDATGLGQCKARGCFIAVSP